MSSGGLDSARRGVAIAALLLLAACSPGTVADEGSAADGEGGRLDFSLPDVRGGQVEGAELAGKDVALWFWAPW
ncbi:MAG TPA: hypothetical protein VML96_07755 [Egibacteraceae bacterium]|nr:hypothetical protein [Egibacteraceae bacterium]